MRCAAAAHKLEEHQSEGHGMCCPARGDGPGGDPQRAAGRLGESLARKPRGTDRPSQAARCIASARSKEALSPLASFQCHSSSSPLRSSMSAEQLSTQSPSLQ